MLARDAKRGVSADPGPKNNPGEKRYIPRWEVKNRILCKFQGEDNVHECRSRDLSCAGMSLETQQDIAIGQKVKLTIYLSQKKTLEVDGHILWAKRTPQGSVAGVIFENTKPETQDLILDYAFEIKREDVVKHWFQGWDENS